MSREHERAAAWRKRHGWSLEALSVLSGYSRSSILWFERGRTPAGTAINEFCWQRYRRVCHSVEAEHRGGRKFGW